MAAFALTDIIREESRQTIEVLYGMGNEVAMLTGDSEDVAKAVSEKLVWATGYNVFALPLAAWILGPIGILLSPAIGAVFMSLSTIIVGINAHRVKGIDLLV